MKPQACFIFTLVVHVAKESIYAQPATFVRDPCSDVTCYNGGWCKSGSNAPVCVCPSPWTGNQCEVRTIDPCRGFQCYNGGFCISPLDAPVCRCLPGFTGDRCQTAIGGVKPGRCPNVPGEFGPCWGFPCSSDSDCRGNYKCCINSCGDNSCILPLPELPPPPPPVDMANPCANVLCDVNTVCRVVFKCVTCPPTVQCVDPKLIPIGIDDVCRGRGFQGSLLVDGPAPNTNYTSLRCTQDCPPGSTCVKTEACCGVCCRGQSLPPRVKPGTCPTVELIACSQTRCQNDDQCPDNLKCCQSCGNRCSVPISPGATDTCRPPCQPGTSCVSKISDCPPGQPCTQVYKPGCVPVDCLNCTDTCVPKKLTAGFECKPKTGCLKPCPPGQQCQYVTTLCSPGEQTNPTCKEVYECRQVDPCGGCPRGRTCIYTGNRCPDPTCPTFQCVVDNECGGCPDGLRCRQRLACRPPNNCDPKLYSGSNPCGTETCSSIFECVLN